MARRYSLFLAALLPLLLCGCATAPKLSGAGVANIATEWSARRAALLSLKQFEFNSRIAIANGEEGSSGSFDWQQSGTHTSAQLAGPLGIGGVQIDADGDVLLVTASNGISLQGNAARLVMQRALGFELPLVSFGYWLRGCDDPATAAERTLDGEQRLAVLSQDGWQINYESYQQVGVYALPQRLNMSRDQLRLKFNIQSWSLMP
jgi:outer membrane lipoprotein LolB